MGDISREHKTGPRTEPCGTPRVHLVVADLADWMRTTDFWGAVAAKPVEGVTRNTEAGVKSIEENVVV